MIVILQGSQEYVDDQASILHSQVKLLSTIRFTIIRSIWSLLCKGGFASILVKLLGAILALLSAVLLARLLGPANYGVYAVAMAIIMLCTAPIQSGISHLVVRESARTDIKDDSEAIGSLIRWSDIYVMRISGVIIVIMSISWFAVSKLEVSANVAWTNVTVLGVLLVSSMPLTAIRGSSLRGLGHTILGQLPESVGRPAVFLILLLMANIALPRLAENPMAAMAMNSTAGMGALLISALLLNNRVKYRSHITALENARRWGQLFRPLLFVSALQLLTTSIDVLVLGWVRSEEEVGVYKVVTQLGSLVIFGLMAINPLLHGQLSKLYAQGQLEKLQTLITQSSRLILILSLPPVLVLFVWNDWILVSIFGKSYATGDTTLRIYLLGQFANAVFGSVGAILNMTGHERDTLTGMLIAVIINLILNLILIPIYGINGAATATAISLFSWNLYLWCIVRKRLGIESGFWGITRLTLDKISIQNRRVS